MFRRSNDAKGSMIFAAIVWILFLAKARCQFVSEISMISCAFDTSDCEWRIFRADSLWKMSNSTQDSDIPDNGKAFILLRGTSVKATVSMLISPRFQTLPRKISLKQRIFCSGNPKLALYFFETTGNEMWILTAMNCSKDESWEETTEHSEADSDDPEDGESVGGFQILLAGTVKQGDVIAIQDLRLRDDTVVIENTTTSSEDDIKNETTTSSLSTVSNTTLTSEEDLQSTTEMSFPYKEINSTANNFSSTNSLPITEEYQNDTTITSALSERISTEESIRTPLFTKDPSTEESSSTPLPTKNPSTEENTSTPLSTKNTSTDESTRTPLSTKDPSTEESTSTPLPTKNPSTEESTSTPLSTRNTSTEESIISTLTDTQDYSDSLSNVTEDISTQNITFTTSQGLENQTYNSSVSPNTSSSKSENKDQKTTTSTSMEDSTTNGSTDSGNKSLIIQNDVFLWRTVFISTLTAFFVYSLLSLLVNVIRKLMRRRKQWMIGRRSENTTVRVEDREVIPLSVISKI